MKKKLSWVGMYKILHQMMKTEPESQTIVDLIRIYGTN
jgi:hypothetical protein